MSVSFKLNGINVQFPFEPYQLQKAYMAQIIRSAKNKKNALLESPTGTGKTLSVLCASLAWLNSEIQLKRSKLLIGRSDDADLDGHYFDNDDIRGNADETDEFEFMPKIYFSSRTHSQLSQSIKELKKANFSNNTAIVLAGRDVLCLNEDVQKLDNIGAKNQACKSKIGANCSCKFYNDVEKKMKDTRDYYDNPVLDVEDLVRFGNKHSICPYFASRVVQRKAQVVFLPYNYLLDPKIRRAQKLQFNDDIIIFDEGHNIEKTCEESISVDLRSDHLAVCIREMQNIYQFYQQSIENLMLQDSATLDAVKEFSAEDILTLKQILDDLEVNIDAKVATFVAQNKLKGDVCENQWIFELLKNCNLNFENTQRVCEICDKIQAFLTCILPVKGPVALAASSSLNSFKDFLSILFPDDSESVVDFQNIFKQKFRVYLEIVEEEEPKAIQQTNFKRGTMSDWCKTAKPNPQQSNKVRKWIVHVWCLSLSVCNIGFFPTRRQCNIGILRYYSVGLKSLIKSNIRSVVLTSGTLAPLDSFETEFDIKFDCKIQNPHIIKSSQMAIYPVSESYSRTQLSSLYSNKDNIQYYKALGDTIVDICNNVPDGILVFFQSYAVMNNSLKKWKDNDSSWKIWSKLNKLKPVFQEVKSKEEFNEQITKYRESVVSGRGAAFFAICRWKLSEGIDLSDVHSRAVILVGLPYPSTQDPRVKLKRSYLDTAKFENFTSNIWYSLQMKRALNQAIGRAIRHKDDYGCVFLLDHRFENQTQDLSKWCRDFVRYPTTYSDMIIEVKKFFENNRVSETSRRAAMPATSIVKESIDQDENKDVACALDFSLSEYTRKSKKRQSNKRTVFNSSLGENSKKAKKLPEKIGNVFDLFETSNTIKELVDQSSRKRKHIPIEYDTSSSSQEESRSNSTNNVDQGLSSNDSIIMLDD